MAGGLHRVGVSCVNFLSEVLRLEIGATPKSTSRNISAAFPSPSSRRPAPQEARNQDHLQAGSEIFETTEFSFDKLSERLREKSFLNKGVKITIKDERSETEKSHEFLYLGGIAEFVKHLNKNKNVLHAKPVYFDKVAAGNDNLAIEVAIQYNDGYDEKVFSFANNINTVGGGSHLSGSARRSHGRSTPMRSLRPDSRFQGRSPGDVREGLVA